MFPFRPNTGKYGLEKTPYWDTFHAVENSINKQYRYSQIQNVETPGAENPKENDKKTQKQTIKCTKIPFWKSVEFSMTLK